PRPAATPRAKPKTRRSYGGRRVDIVDPECTALTPRHLAGKIEGLDIRAAITDLPDILEKHRELEWLWLTETKIRRIPDVLARMPWVTYLGLNRNPLDTLAELAKLPHLTKLVIWHWPGIPIETLPELPNLASLTLEHCNLRE